MSIEKVSRASALFLFNQLTGTYSGQMADVPHNPMLHGFMRAHIGKVVKDRSYRIEMSLPGFSDFLRQVADHLDPVPPKVYIGGLCPECGNHTLGCADPNSGMHYVCTHDGCDYSILTKE